METVAAVVAAALILSPLAGWELAAVAWWALVGLALSFVDLAAHRLPTRLIAIMSIGTVAPLTIAAAASGGWSRLLWAFAAAAGLAVLLAALALLSPRGLGLGDAQLGVPIGLLLGWWGWPTLLAGVAWTALLSFIVAVALLIARRASWSSSLAYGPFLCAGTLIAVVLAACRVP